MSGLPHVDSFLLSGQFYPFPPSPQVFKSTCHLSSTNLINSSLPPHPMGSLLPLHSCLMGAYYYHNGSLTSYTLYKIHMYFLNKCSRIFLTNFFLFNSVDYLWLFILFVNLLTAFKHQENLRGSKILSDSPTHFCFHKWSYMLTKTVSDIVYAC